MVVFIPKLPVVNKYILSVAAPDTNDLKTKLSDASFINCHPVSLVLPILGTLAKFKYVLLFAPEPLECIAIPVVTLVISSTLSVGIFVPRPNLWLAKS